MPGQFGSWDLNLRGGGRRFRRGTFEVLQGQVRFLSHRVNGPDHALAEPKAGDGQIQADGLDSSCRLGVVSQVSVRGVHEAAPNKSGRTRGKANSHAETIWVAVGGD